MTIVTLTMNPALDITMTANHVRHTEKVRCRDARYDAGGGGINVAHLAQVLGETVYAVFPAGGQSGQVVADLVARAGVRFDRIKIAEATRESVTVNDARTGQQYRFVLQGPRLSFAEQAQCLDALRNAARSAEFVVASGSLPPGVPADYYQRVADICAGLGTRLVLDTSGDGLRHISSGVFLLKASVRELREYVECDLAGEPEQVAAAQQLIRRGVARTVVVSLGAQGALVATARGSQRFSPISTRPVSGVGAGDAMVAAITVGLSRGWPLDKAVRFGIAAGAAMLMTPGTAACKRADVERLFELAPEPTDV